MIRVSDSKKNNLVLVTGGAGFIGSHLVDALLEKGFQVRVLDNLVNGSLENLAEASISSRFEFLKGDILSTGDCRRAVENADFVFHLACLGVRHSIHSPFENHRVNAEGTLNMLMASKAAGARHFFYISTSEIYGATRSFPITENSDTNPLTVYGASKLAGEHYTNAFNECYGLPTTVFRIFNNYGPRAHYEGDAGEIIPRSIVRILYGEQPVLFGDGSITRDFFYVKDTAAALIIFLEMAKGSRQPEIIRQTFNIGAGSEMSMKVLIEKIIAMMNQPGISIQYLDARPADVPRLWVDAGKFNDITSFRQKFSFEQGLEETIRFYMKKKEMKNLISEIKLNNWE